ncbi:MAG: PAS domain S-box protein [Nitrospirota bacterium]
MRKIKKTCKESNQKLEAVQKRVEYLLADSPAIFYICNIRKTWVCTYVSENITKQLGYTPAEFCENPDFRDEGIHPDDKQRVFDGLSRLRGNGHFVYEYRFLNKSGKYRWMRDELKLTYDADGNPVDCIGFLLDITDRKLMEEELRRAQARTEAVLAGVADTYIIFDQEWHYTYVNEAASRAMGRPREEILGRTLWEVFPDIVGTELDRQYHRSMDERVPVVFEFYYPAFDSWWENRFYPAPEGLAVFATNITGRKRVEEKLRESERKFRALFESSHDVILFLDRAGNIIDINPRAEQLSGYTQSELRKMNVFELVIAEDQPIVRQAIQDAFEGRSRTYEKRVKTKGGGLIWFEGLTVPRLSPEGEVHQLFVTLRDITDRRQAEEELLYFQMAVGSATDAIGMSTPAGRHYYQNEAYTKLFGLSVREVDGVSGPPATVYADEKVGRKVFDIIMNGGSFVGEVKMLDKDRKERDIYLRAYSIKNKEGKVAGLVGVHNDITERRRVEQQTKDTLNFIRTMMESSPIGIVSIKATGAVVAANEALTRIMGGMVEQFLKQNVRDLEAWKKYGLLSAMNEALTTNSEKRIETDYISTFGKHVWISVRFVPFTFEREPHVLALFADMSDQKRDEMEKEKLQSQLLQAQKMESIGTLAGGIAHDFNNILTAIIGYGHITLMKMPKDEPLRMNIENILESADRAAALTQSLLAFSRKQIIDRKPVDLNKILNKVEKFLIRVIGEDVEVRMDLKKATLTLFADAGQLEQVFMNLATNARDAMPNGGSFTIASEITELDNSFVAAHGYGKVGTYALISVTDTGIGMTEETKLKIFEPFYTTKEVGKGTGLGLAMVYGIIKQHDGFINVYSERGKGTTFKIYLPLIKTEAMEDQPIIAAEDMKGGTETILLAEDDSAVRKLNLLVLEQAGYTVIIANDGDEAVMKFMENKDRIQLLLFDIVMPKKNGREAYEEIKKTRPEIPVLFASGYSPDMVRVKALVDADTALVYKPISPQSLLKKVREVLDRKR